MINSKILKKSGIILASNIVLKALQTILLLYLILYHGTNQTISNFYICIAAMQLVAMITGFGIGEELNSSKIRKYSMSTLQIIAHKSWLSNFKFSLLIVFFILLYGLFISSSVEILIFSFTGLILSYTKNISLIYQKYGKIGLTMFWGNGFTLLIYFLSIFILLITENLLYSGVFTFGLSLVIPSFHFYKMTRSEKIEKINLLNFDFVAVSFLAWILNLGFTFIMKFESSNEEISSYVLSMQLLGVFVFLPTSLFQSLNPLINSKSDIVLNKIYNKSFNILSFIIIGLTMVGYFTLQVLKDSNFYGYNIENILNAYLFSGLTSLAMTGYYQILLLVYQRGNSRIFRNIVVLIDLIFILISISFLIFYGLKYVLLSMSLNYFVKVLFLNIFHNTQINYIWSGLYISCFILSIILFL